MDVEIDSGLGQADQIFVGIDAADIKMNLSASRYFSLIILGEMERVFGGK